MGDNRRHLPSVHQVLEWDSVADVIATHGHQLTVAAVRDTLAAEREFVRTATNGYEFSQADFEAAVIAHIETQLAPTLFPVINATGVIIHTNLGRAPLSRAAVSAMQDVSSAYSNLEFDIESGKRGSRSTHASALVRRVTGAEDATVANNTAAGVVLMLSALCAGREVIISRGQLVEIGGGFRVPDVMVQSGATLVEVGTTNRTHLQDYADAITENTAAIMVAHHSNFKIIGFTTEPTIDALAELAQERQIMLLYDQGSGALVDTTQYGVDAEPTVQAGIAAGADVVAFSGDKLLGGPQAGVLCGKADVIASIKRHPLARAVRPDKTCLAGLAATLASYERGMAEQEIPIWHMMAKSAESIRTTAERWQTHLATQGIESEVEAGHSMIGGGSLPGQQLPTWRLRLHTPTPDALAKQLRTHEAPVIGRIQHDAIYLDPRTVLDGQEDILLATVVAATNNL